jgi:tetratricopeptide (TPR) repeat protein
MDDGEAAIRAYTEAVQLEPKLRRALRQLRRLYEQRGSWEAVLQIGEQEAALAESSEERARAYVVMADVWQRHLGDRDQAEQLWARARDGPIRARAQRPHRRRSHTLRPRRAREAPRRHPPRARGRGPLGARFEFYPDLECDLEIDEIADDVGATPIASDERSSHSTPRRALQARAVTGAQRSACSALGASRRARMRGAGLDAGRCTCGCGSPSCAGVIGDPVAAIAALEPALAARAPARVSTLAGLYEQLRRSEPLIDLAERAASASELREQRAFWLRRAAEVARADGAPERAIECYRRLLADLPHDHGARAALGDLYRSRGEIQPLVALLREELPRASADRELDLQLELASLLAESLGDPSGAVPHLRRCLELEPMRSDLLGGRSARRSAASLGQLDLVVTCDRRADAARAALSHAAARFADALQWNEAAELARRARARSGSVAGARAARGGVIAAVAAAAPACSGSARLGSA